VHPAKRRILIDDAGRVERPAHVVLVVGSAQDRRL
jgi:hypothetical protein